MAKYRKKPVIVNAWKFPDELDKIPEEIIMQYPIDSIEEWTCKNCNKKASKHSNIKTLEGFHIVCPGDYIIKGVNGEFYPCKPDIFHKTYEKVEEED